jgi:hypothetical protein
MSANGNGHSWSKFWWSDWQSDKALQSCSLGARGLWIEILAVCHASERPGYFLINGEPPTIQEMADMFGRTKPSEVSKYLDELCRRKVFSLDGNAIYCRRMVRDTIASEAGREAAERRWKSNVLPKDEPPGPITPPNGSPNSQPNSQPNGSPIREPNAKKLEAEAERKEGPPLGSPPKPGGRRATLLPEDWVPNPKAMALGVDLGLAAAEVLFEADRMRDWARDKRAKGADWDARFANWLRREALDRRAQRYRAQPAKPTLAEEWGLKSFLTPNFDDDEEPEPGRLLS